MKDRQKRKKGGSKDRKTAESKASKKHEKWRQKRQKKGWKKGNGKNKSIQKNATEIMKIAK